jgi:hypothetical protein
MKKYLFIFLFGCLIVKTTAAATTVTPPPAPSHKISLLSFLSMKPNDFEKLTGKHLPLKEKIVFKLAQWKLKHMLHKQGKKKGKGDKAETALTLSIIALSCLVIGLFLPFIFIASLPLAIIALVTAYNVKKKDPANKKAATAITLGWVTIGLLALLVILIIIILASFSFSFE